MKMALLFGSLLLSATALSAQTPSSTSPAEGSTTSPSDMICRTQGETGSRLQRTRVCRTRAQWEEQRRENRQALERTQNTRTTSGN